MEEARTLLAKPLRDHGDDDDKRSRIEMRSSLTSVDTIPWGDDACHSSSSSYSAIDFDPVSIVEHDNEKINIVINIAFL